MDRKKLINNINNQENPKLLRFFIVQYLTKYEFLLEFNSMNKLEYIWFLSNKRICMIIIKDLEEISFDINNNQFYDTYCYIPESDDNLKDLVKSNLFSEKSRFKNKKILQILIKKYEVHTN
jgi:hypothetical protein